MRVINGMEASRLEQRECRAVGMEADKCQVLPLSCARSSAIPELMPAHPSGWAHVSPAKELNKAKVAAEASSENCAVRASCREPS